MSEWTSEDFIAFGTDDLIEELVRRSRTIVLALEIDAPQDIDDDDDSNNKIRFSHNGDIFARVGMAQLLLTHTSRMTRELLDQME